MKFLLFLTLVLCSEVQINQSQSVGNVDQEYEELSKHLRQIISDQMLSIFTTTPKSIFSNFGDLRAPNLPPYPDPLILDDMNITLNQPALFGQVYVYNSAIHGLSTLNDIVNVTHLENPKGYRVKLIANVPGEIRGAGNYSCDIHIDIGNGGGPKPITGAGGDLLTLTNFTFEWEIEVRAVNNSNETNINVQVTFFALDIRIGKMSVHADNSYYDGMPFPWDAFNLIFKVAFDGIWKASKENIAAELKGVINSYMTECTIADLPNLIEGDTSCYTEEPVTPNPNPVTPPGDGGGVGKIGLPSVQTLFILTAILTYHFFL